jgi:MYXO-CTERM domain-containing protein
MRASRLPSIELLVIFFFAVVLAMTSWPSVAHAAGSARLKGSEIQEVSGAWHVFVRIELPKAPPIAHVPMKFVFTKLAVYERAQTDTGLVTNRQPLQNQLPSTESLDVDFANAQGKIYNRTDFDFGLTRTRGYEAGEYKLQIRTSDGIEIGSPMQLTLKGDNPIVDRRSITFEARKKGMEKVDNGLDGGSAQQAKNSGDDTSSAGPGNGEVAATGSAAPFIPNDAYQPTDEEKIKEKPGGCGCSTPGLSRRASALVGFAALAMAAALLSRRRRRS